MEAGGHGEVTQAYTIMLSKTRNVWHMHARQMFKWLIHPMVNTARSYFSSDLWAHADLAVSML